jgi:hypothetical protein
MTLRSKCVCLYVVCAYPPHAYTRTNRFLRRDLEGRGVSTRLAPTLPGTATPTSYITRSQQNGSRTIVLYRNLPELDWDHVHHVQWGEFAWLHLEGLFCFAFHSPVCASLASSGCFFAFPSMVAHTHTSKTAPVLAHRPPVTLLMKGRQPFLRTAKMLRELASKYSFRISIELEKPGPWTDEFIPIGDVVRHCSSLLRL